MREGAGLTDVLTSNLQQRIAGTDLCVHAGVGGGGIVIGSYWGKRHHTAPVPVDCNPGIGDVVVWNRHETLLEQVPGMRIQHKIGDAGLGDALDGTAESRALQSLYSRLALSPKTRDIFLLPDICACQLEYSNCLDI